MRISEISKRITKQKKNKGGVAGLTQTKLKLPQKSPVVAKKETPVKHEVVKLDDSAKKF